MARLTPDEPDLSWLPNLGLRFVERYEIRGSMEDLDRALATLRQSLRIIPQDHPLYWASRIHVSHVLSLRYDRMRLFNDLHEVIVILESEVVIIPCTHPSYLSCLTQYVIALKIRWEELRSDGDLDQAIKIAEKVVVLQGQRESSISDHLMNPSITSLQERSFRGDSVYRLSQIKRKAFSRSCTVTKQFSESISTEV